MNDKEFIHFADALKEYLDAKKQFKINKERFTELQRMVDIAHTLFPNMRISIEDDPLQLGRLILSIKGYDIIINNEDKIKMFAELIFNADNFEICPLPDEELEFALMYNDIFDVELITE